MGSRSNPCHAVSCSGSRYGCSASGPGTETTICITTTSIRVPTLVIHRTEDIIPVEGARWLAGQIPGARFVELAGDDHWPWITDPDEIVDEVEEFLTGERHEPEPDRVLATVLFTDIVGSTERAAEIGDRRWRDLLEQHDGSSATNSSDTGVGR